MNLEYSCSLLYYVIKVVTVYAILMQPPQCITCSISYNSYGIPRMQSVISTSIIQWGTYILWQNTPRVTKPAGQPVESGSQAIILQGSCASPRVTCKPASILVSLKKKANFPYCYPSFVNYAKTGIIFPFRHAINVKKKLRKDIQILSCDITAALFSPFDLFACHFCDVLPVMNPKKSEFEIKIWGKSLHPLKFWVVLVLYFSSLHKLTITDLEPHTNVRVKWLFQPWLFSWRSTVPQGKAFPVPVHHALLNQVFRLQNW